MGQISTFLRSPADEPPPPEKRVIMLRAYAEPPHKERWSRRKPLNSSGYELIFDTETTADASQRLRFGVYQVRVNGFPIEQGIFFHPKEQHQGDIELLKDYAGRHGLEC